MAQPARMHQTTVRFTADLWAQLQQAAAECGVSAAQFVRDAILTQLAYASARRDEAAAADSPHDTAALGAAAARAHAVGHQQDANAVWAQARLARDRARSLREHAEAVRERVARHR